jgi:hypothetical protein
LLRSGFPAPWPKSAADTTGHYRYVSVLLHLT